MNGQVRALTLEYLDDFEMPAKIYTLLSAVCFVLDTVSGLVFVILTGSQVGPKKVMHGAQLFSVTLYFYLDLVYLAYVAHFCLRLPTVHRMYTGKALMGFGDEIRTAFG